MDGDPVSRHARIMALSVHRNREWPKVKVWAQMSAPGIKHTYRHGLYHVWLGPFLFQWTPKDLRQHIASTAAPLPPQ